MNEQLRLLIELQVIESALLKNVTRKKELPDKLAKLENEYQLATQEFDEFRNKLDELVKLHKEKESQLKKNQDQIKKTKDRQLDVKTNKEYQAILKEIETIEEKNSQLEDLIISAMDEIDNFKEKVKVSERDFADRKKVYNADKVSLEQEIKALDEEFSALEIKNQELRKKIAAGHLKRFEQIKNVNNGVAVVYAWKEVCGGCHMNMPPQLYNELQKTDEIIKCPNCYRILYWEDRNKNGDSV